MFFHSVPNQKMNTLGPIIKDHLPLRKGGEHEFKNICLVISPLAKLKRYFTEEEIVHMAADILKFKGEKYGYQIEQGKRRK
ncbi:hypothetical protein LEP1GSC100_0443 [Leptospira interrogans serovar Bataviae str. UI 08561]|nr:hypothetical protein LEP1GSC100_0443 [Leptospira interrogans serovar Bataviae str. UI 08561]